MKVTKRDRLQVSAFGAFYKSHRMAEMSKEMSFAGAIEKTSDDRFDEIVASPERTAALEIWMNQPRRSNNRPQNL